MNKRLPRKITRRTFLSTSTKLALGVSGILLGNTGLFYYGAVHEKSRTNQTDTATREIPGNYVKVGEVETLQAMTGFEKVHYNGLIQDAWVKTPQKGFVYLTKDDSGALCILSPLCTHLGCYVEPTTEAQRKNKKELFFLCPCHGAEFDVIGNAVGEALPRLGTYQPIIIDGSVYIDIAAT